MKRVGVAKEQEEKNQKIDDNNKNKTDLPHVMVATVHAGAFEWGIREFP
jgi:hypothetical protein